MQQASSTADSTHDMSIANPSPDNNHDGSEAKCEQHEQTCHHFGKSIADFAKTKDMAQNTVVAEISEHRQGRGVSQHDQMRLSTHIQC